jgi:protein TonB
MLYLLSKIGLVGLGLLFVATIVAVVYLFRYLLDKKSESLKASPNKSPHNPLEKKFYDVDINKYAGVFSNIGWVLSLAVILAAFEMPEYEVKEIVKLVAVQSQTEEVIDVPITTQPPPPPPKLVQPQIVEVPDEVEVKKEVEVELDVDLNENTVVTEPVAVVATPGPAVVEEEVEEVFTIVEETAEPVGGMPAFYKYLGENIKYPKDARKMGIEGKVFLQFVVDKDGAIKDIVVVRGLHPTCDEEAKRVLEQAPKWKPGKQRGRPVKQRMTIPISFKLN